MLGDYIKAERGRRGWTQLALSERSGVAQSYISTLEKGTHTKPGMDVLEGLARAFTMTVPDLLLAAGAPGPSPRTPTPAELRAFAADQGVSRARTVLDSLQVLEKQYHELSESDWHVMVGMFNSLVMQEAQQAAQGQERVSPTANAQRQPEAPDTPGARRYQAQGVGSHYIHDERGEYQPGPAVGC